MNFKEIRDQFIEYGELVYESEVNQIQKATAIAVIEEIENFGNNYAGSGDVIHWITTQLLPKLNQLKQ